MATKSNRYRCRYCSHVYDEALGDPDSGIAPGTAFADIQSSTAPTDTDLDGMPDDWEEAVGYNKAVANNNAVLTTPQTAASFFPTGSPTGYTQLEEYLHFMAVPPDGDGLVGRLTGFEMTQVGPGHKTKNWQDRGPLEQGRGSCQPHFLTIQIFR